MAHRALITGASAGLGQEFSRQLAARAIDLLLVARNGDRLEALAKELRGQHAIDVQVFACDLSSGDAPGSIEQFAEARGLSIDYLVNNAGIAGPHLLNERRWEMQAAFLQLMVGSVAELCHRFVPPMVERGFGRVVNVSSFGARLPRAEGANYGPAKAYLVSLSEELSLELEGSGVHVTALCPGFVHTEFHDRAGLSETKRSLPNWLWYDASTVVREGLSAVEQGKPVHVTGRVYRWLDPFAQSVWSRPFMKSF